MKSRTIAIALIAAFAASCGKISVPVTGALADGSAVTGEAYARLDGRGGFHVQTNTTRCAGTYNAYDASKQITIPVTCNDGRTGTVIATRDALGTSGTAVVTLDDGMTGSFSFGSRR